VEDDFIAFVRPCVWPSDVCLSLVQYNVEGDSIVFVYRIGLCPEFFGEYFRTYLFTISTNGQDLWRLPLAEGSFHDYGANGRILVCEKVRPRFPDMAPRCPNGTCAPSLGRMPVPRQSRCAVPDRQTGTLKLLEPSCVAGKR
jgi:hypothetical protein